jgi:putative hydrolase
MEFYGDYHTHTKYSDGKTTCRQNVLAAIEKGLKELAITDHGFHNARVGSLRPAAFQKQRQEIQALRQELGDKVKIYHGIEADFTSLDGTIDLSEGQLALPDIIVCGFHPVVRPKTFYDRRKLFWQAYRNKIFAPSPDIIARNTQAYIKAVERYPIDILAHLNRNLSVDCLEIAKAAADYGVYIELNAKYNLISHHAFEKMLQTDVTFIVSSDAHIAPKIGDFRPVTDYFFSLFSDPSRVVNLNQKPVFHKKGL